jgi:hypothetical protein
MMFFTTKDTKDTKPKSILTFVSIASFVVNAECA